MKKYAILVISFDGYSDVWDVFFECYNKFWKCNTNNLYLVTNNLNPEFLNVNIIKTGEEKSWSNRVRTALEQIDEDFLLVMLEDYFISRNVNQQNLDNLFNTVVEEKIDYLRLVPIPYEYRYKKKGIYNLNDKFIYGVNLQTAFWSKDYLKRLLYDDNFSAWEFEARQKNNNPKRIMGKCKTLNYWGIDYLNGIIQGKWYPKTIKQLCNLGVRVKCNDRKVLSRGKLIQMGIKNWLLHHIPIEVIKLFKPILIKLGIVFVTKD